MNVEWVGENIVDKWRPEQMNKLLNKQVGDDCALVQIVAATVHTCVRGKWGMMEETKWASNGG